MLDHGAILKSPKVFSLNWHLRTKYHGRAPRVKANTVIARQEKKRPFARVTSVRRIVGEFSGQDGKDFTMER